MDMDDPVFDENNASLVQNSTAEEATNRSSEGMQITKIGFLESNNKKVADLDQYQNVI